VRAGDTSPASRLADSSREALPRDGRLRDDRFVEPLLEQAGASSRPQLQVDRVEKQEATSGLVEASLSSGPPDPRTPEDHYAALLLAENYFGSPDNVMFCRSLLDAVGLFDSAVDGLEDYDPYLRIAR
jgi:hypothetical protein